MKHIIEHTFETEVGKSHQMKEDFDFRKDPVPAMHIGWQISPYAESQKVDGEQAFQYKTAHMLICGPCNYVYVTRQDEIVDMDGNTSFGEVEILSYHDSCWRDAIDRFIHENRNVLQQARSKKDLMGWYDVFQLSPEEVEFLRKVEQWRRNLWHKEDPRPEELCGKHDPFKKRWAKR